MFLDVFDDTIVFTHCQSTKRRFYLCIFTIYFDIFYIIRTVIFIKYFIYRFSFCISKVYISLFPLFFNISLVSFLLFYTSFTFICNYSYCIFSFFTFFSCFFSFSLFTFINIFVIIITKIIAFAGDVLWGLQLQN